MAEEDSIKAMSDEDLQDKKAALQAEIEHRETVAQNAVRAGIIARNTAIKNALDANDGALLDILAPEHSRPRYGGNECDDNNLYGAIRRTEDAKEYGCLRCQLLTMVLTSDYDLGDIEFHVEVSGEF